MQIVIDIPDGIYQDIEKRDWKNTIWARDSLMRYIHEGVVLPKHHGRLIDVDVLKKYIDDCDCCVGCEDESYGCADKCKCPDYLDEGMERIINNQPIVLCQGGGNR